MKALVKIGTNSVTSVIEDKLGISAEEAEAVYKNLLVERGRVKTASEASVYLQRKKIAQWQDGDIVTVQPDDWNWGTLELKHFLIITVPDGVDLTGPKEEVINPGTEDEYREFLGPARYRFPYWDSLSPEDLSKVRDRDATHQPLFDTSIKVKDMVEL